MGFLSQLLGKKHDYPPLEPSDPAAARLEKVKEPLSRLAAEIGGPLEIVPSDERAFVFIGNPPKKFGVAWVDSEGRTHNFKSLVEEKGLSVVTLEKLSDELKAAYVRHEGESRFSASLGEHEIVVTPSEPLCGEISGIIQKFAS
jgi:hypothetical protein